METQREESFIHVNENGDMFYYKDKDMKILHRLDGPAIEYADGEKEWYVNGRHLCMVNKQGKIIYKMCE